VGLGKGAIPTAAAVNWVLRDGIGYLSKIVLSKYGRHFDVHPKGWRLVSDVIENMSYGLELLTPTFPHLFVYLAAAAGAGRSAAGLIQVQSSYIRVKFRCAQLGHVKQLANFGNSCAELDYAIKVNHKYWKSVLYGNALYGS
jgi:hypothetical protein